MRDASIKVLRRRSGVETGGSNGAVSRSIPDDGRLGDHRDESAGVALLRALPRRPPGFPIAKVAAKLAVGYTLDEIANDITGGATPGRRLSPPSITSSPRSRAFCLRENSPGADAVLTHFR